MAEGHATTGAATALPDSIKRGSYRRKTRHPENYGRRMDGSGFEAHLQTSGGVDDHCLDFSQLKC